MGKISRSEFIRRWVMREGASQLSRQDQAAMIADLDDVIDYAGGNVEKAKELTKEEKDKNRSPITDEELERRNT